PPHFAIGCAHCAQKIREPSQNRVRQAAAHRDRATLAACARIPADGERVPRGDRRIHRLRERADAATTTATLSRSALPPSTYIRRQARAAFCASFPRSLNTSASAPPSE